MKKIVILLFIFCYFFIISKSESAQLGKGRRYIERRIIGGIVGTTVGFGTGHMITGEWMEKGWIFTSLEVSSLAVVATKTRKSIFFTHGDNSKAKSYVLIGLMTFAITRIVEIIDVWGGSYGYVQNRRHNNIMKRVNENELNLSIIPLKTSNNLTLGVGLSTSF